MDNLDSQTYDIFEKDPTKYTQYEKVYSSLLSVGLRQGKVVQLSVIAKQLVSYFFAIFAQL